ncbi:MetQ/NlpA family ABC transporter substrate-binding protein [uncultured Gulosibacter sp.]|uniref:MetQ/NlpA family ABC transporter substrate-binding protein n=1 Tax=uncultured Gulosibacter sp. TaxID=1339167 RepID=UPI00288C0B7E|nr:MetQ/NlpA family ABC transporter substrate-binding protein [uncultured Gulosibacter sp.]
MKITKIAKIAAATAAAALALTGCTAGDDTSDATTAEGEVVTLKVGASPVPHADILNFINDNLAEDAGLKLEIVEYTDYVQPNVALSEGELDANFFQHVPYFDAEVAEKGYNFEHGEGVQIEPYGIYSKQLTDLKDLPEGGKVLVNNDPSNQARALKLLEQEGIIGLGGAENPTIYEIADNPKNLKFTEAEAAVIPVQLPDVDIAVINGNYALEHDLNPAKDALALESGKDNPYANVLAWNKDADKAEAIAKLEKLLHDPKVADFIREKYPDGEIVPAF